MNSLDRFPLPLLLAFQLLECHQDPLLRERSGCPDLALPVGYSYVEVTQDIGDLRLSHPQFQTRLPQLLAELLRPSW